MDPQIAGYLLIGAHAFKNDPKLQEWEEFSRDELINYLNDYFKTEDFEESVVALEQYVKATLESSTLPIDVIESNIAESEEDKEKRRLIKEKSHREVTASLDRQRALAPKQRPVTQKKQTEAEQWQEINKDLTLKIQNQLIAFDSALAQDPELLEKLTEEIKTDVASLALNGEGSEIEKNLAPLVNEALTKNGYLINAQKQEALIKDLYESTQKEAQEIHATNDSPLSQEILNNYAQNTENVIFTPAYVLANPSLLVAYSQKAFVALPVKFLQQSASETSPEWQKMLNQGVFVENYDLTIQNLIKSGLSENHPAIIKLQGERDRLYEAQKNSAGKDKPLVGLLKTFFKPNELTGNQKGTSDSTGIAISGKTLWSGKGWAFNLKNTFNQIGLASKIYQKFPSLPGKTLVTSRFSIGALAWSNRRLWRPVYLAVAKTAAGKAVKVGLKKASVWVATKLGLQAAITAAGIGTGPGIVVAAVVNLAIEAVSFVYNKFIKPLLQKIKNNPLATIAIGVGIVVIIPSFAVVGIIIAALGTFIALTGAGGILGGIAFTTVSFFTALVAGPVVGVSVATLVVLGLIVLSSLTFFIVMTTAGAFILPQGASLRVAGPPVITVAPNCTATRHLAEEVVCQLQSCNLQYVVSSTIDETEKCLSQSNLPNKETIISYFRASVLAPRNDGKLQCVGFVQGVMAAMGHPLAGRDAKNYILETPPPSGYISFNDPNQIQVGDLAVKTTNDFGHIMVIIAKDGDKLTVSQADGGTGVVGNGIIPASFVSKIGGFLRAN
jgi:hypothetical protein